MCDPVISVKNLNKFFGEIKVINNLTLEVNENECFGFLGPNGAGKTTTMRILYGRLEPFYSKETIIKVFGLDPKKDSLRIRFNTGIVPQYDNLDEQLNVEENLKMYSKFYGISKIEAKERIRNLLEFMELSKKAKCKVGELSGGMKRRLTIARALINNPKLLILDEPTTGLDPQVRNLIWDKLRELKRKGTTILLTTHYMEEANQICDKIAIMDMGEKIVEGPPKQLIEQNMDKYVMQVYVKKSNKNDYVYYLENKKIKFELFEERLIMYSNSLEEFNEFVRILKDEEHFIRTSDLEDLFLKVTGRRLNELQ